MRVQERGDWPSDWPEELDPCRKRAETWTGAVVPEGPLAATSTIYRIPFSKNADFERVWPAFLRVKSEGAPLTLHSAAEGSALVQVCGWVSPGRQPGYAVELHVDGKVIDLNRIRLPGDTQIVDKRRLSSPHSQPSTQPPDKQVGACEHDHDRPWGESVDGVQCRLRAEMTVWQSGKWPNFRVDLRNDGERKLYRSANPDHWEIELDGVWYCSNSHWLGTLYETWPLFPGEEQTDVLVPLHKELTWQSKESKQPLEFRPGKHTVRIALELKGADKSRSSLWVVSNPVEIMIERAAGNQAVRRRGGQG